LGGGGKRELVPIRWLKTKGNPVTYEHPTTAVVDQENSQGQHMCQHEVGGAWALGNMLAGKNKNRTREAKEGKPGKERWRRKNGLGKGGEQDLRERRPLEGELLEENQGCGLWQEGYA